MPPRLPRRSGGRDIHIISAATWDELIDCLHYAMTHPAGDNVTIVRRGDSLSVLGRAGGGAAGETAAGYDGPFAVIVDPDIENELSGVSIVLYGDPTADLAGYYRYALSRVAVSSAWLPITESCYIYLEITWNGSAYAFEFVTFADELQSAVGIVRVPIAWVEYADDAIAAIRQMQYGDIVLGGLIQ